MTTTDNTVLNGTTQPGGVTVRDIVKNGAKTQVVGLDIGGAGAESLLSAANPMPARISNGTTSAGLEPFGALQVNTGFLTYLLEEWAGTALDTTERWTVTGNAPAVADGNMTMSAALSSYNAIRTKETYRPSIGFTLIRNGIQLAAGPSGLTTGSGRFWGMGTPATTPAPQALCQDAIGYELDQVDGKLLAVTYTNGVRTVIAELTRPTDGALHGYACYFRVTVAYWVLDGAVVATKTFPNLRMTQLPGLIVRQNAAAFTGSPVFVNIGYVAADTSRQGNTIADPVFGNRQARVEPDGALVSHGGAVVPFTAVSGVNLAQTLTIPGVTGLNFYISRIRITMHDTSAGAVAGSAVTLTFGTTNIPGALAWTEGNALEAGRSKTVVDEVLYSPIRTTAAGTATTFTAPACGAGVITRITVYGRYAT